MGTLTPLSKHSWLSSDRPVPRLIGRPLRAFLNTEAAGGIVLLAATVVALVWVNSPFGDSYERLWGIEISLTFGGFELREDLRHWINDALMAIFFFVVGLEIKRELVTGELNNARRALLPALAALGGMIVPAALYVVLNVGKPGSEGWGIPMATDIAFAVGVLALLSDRVPSSLKVFLLSLAIVDDIGAILVIAVFYSDGVGVGWLTAAAALLLASVAARRLGVLWVSFYVIVGGMVWFATFMSGVHATIAGAALGLLTPARPTDPRGFDDVMEEASGMSSQPDANSVRILTRQAQEVVSVAERLEHLLHPWSSYVIIPIFALANAGVVLSTDAIADAARSPVALGIVLGLVVGKIVGIAGVSWVAIRSGVAQAPEGVGWRELCGGSAIAGIGFTVSLFIAGLAFPTGSMVESAKIGVLSGSLLAGIIGSAILAPHSARHPVARG